MPKLNKVQQADGKGWGDRGRKYLKKWKAPLERRRLSGAGQTSTQRPGPPTPASEVGSHNQETET